MKTYLHSPVDAARKIKLQFRVGGLDPPGRKRYTGRQVEEEVDAQNRPCGKVME